MEQSALHRDLAEGVSGEQLLSVLLLQGLLPVLGRELEDSVLRPGWQQAEDVAQVGPGLDVVQLQNTLPNF